MDIDIREILEEEMTKCNALRLYKNRVKKCNDILPDDIMNNVLSFVPCNCKKCVRTRRVIYYENLIIERLRRKWVGFDIEEKIYTDEYEEYMKDGLKIWLYYFTSLNGFMTEKTFQKHITTEFSFTIFKDAYEILPYKNFRFWRYKRNDKDFEKTMLWMFCTRGCQFYPQIFNDEFQREVMRHILG